MASCQKNGEEAMKTLTRKLKSQLFLKYTLSYMLVFIIPFTIMSIFLYQNSIVNLREQAKESIYNKMKQTEQYASERIKELDHMAVEITEDYQLTPYMIGHDFYSKNAISQLKRYRESNAFITSINLYYHGDQRIYSSEGTYDLSTLLHRVPPFTKWTITDFQNKTKKESNSIYLVQDAARSTDNTLVSVQPIPNGDPNPYGAVLYTIKESSLKQSVDNILDGFQGNSYILDASNDLIVTSQSDDSINTSDLKNILKDNEKSGEYKHNGEKYFIATIPSTYNDWRIVSVVNIKEFNKTLFLQKVLFVTLLSLLFLAGLIIALFLGSKQYKPIQNISSKLNFNENVKQGSRSDELKMINHAITNINENNKALNTAVDLQKPFAREQILLKLLKGNLASTQDYKSLFDLLNIKMHKKSYMVSILQFPSLPFDQDQIEFQDELIDYIESLEIDFTTIHAVDLLDDAIALIISMNDEMEEASENRKNLHMEISDIIYNKLGIRPNISVGTPYQDITHINRSYIEALAAMNSQYKIDELNEDETITYFQSQQISETKNITYPHEELTKLTQSIKQGDNEVAHEVLQDIFKLLQESNMKVNYLKAVYFDIVNTIVKSVLDLRLSEEVKNIEHLIDFTNSKQLKNDLHCTIDRVCDLVNAKTAKFNKQLVNDIASYINENYKGNDMSLEKIADRFNLSIPYLSRFIKEQFNLTFSHHIFLLRLDYVKKQLLNSNKLIKDIITEAGYCDVSNFIREFKKAEGITPGQYRKIHRK